MESIPNHRPPTKEEMEEIQRQNHLRYLAENPTKPPEDKDNCVRLETSNALYNIVYSNHGITNNPEDVYGSDVILLEFGRINLENAEKDLTQRLEVNTNFNEQYSEIIKYAAEHSVPVYLIDSNKDSGNYEFIQKLLPTLELYVSYKLLKSSITDSIKQPVTRRSFLKNLGKAAAAAYFSAPVIEAAAIISHNSEPSESSFERNIERKIRPVNELIHPELNSMTLQGRNHIIADKSEYIAKEFGSKLSRKPKISIVIGAAHTGIEDALKMTDEQRMGELKKYLSEQEIEDEKTIFHIEWDNKKPVISRSQM